MRAFPTTLIIAAVASFVASEVRGGNADLEIHVQPKQTDQSGVKGWRGVASGPRSTGLGEITIENKGFKQLDGLEVRGIIFYKQENSAPRILRRRKEVTEAPTSDR